LARENEPRKRSSVRLSELTASRSVLPKNVKRSHDQAFRPFWRLIKEVIRATLRSGRTRSSWKILGGFVIVRDDQVAQIDELVRVAVGLQLTRDAIIHESLPCCVCEHKLDPALLGDACAHGEQP